MTDFYKMSYSEITKEQERFTLQLMRQQAEKIPLTPAQIKRWKALNKAYHTICAEQVK